MLIGVAKVRIVVSGGGGRLVSSGAPGSAFGPGLVGFILRLPLGLAVFLGLVGHGSFDTRAPSTQTWTP